MRIGYNNNVEKTINLPGPHPKLRVRQIRRGNIETGTAIAFDDGVYEIISCDIKDSRCVYTLKPWSHATPAKPVMTWTKKQKDQLIRELKASRTTQQDIPVPLSFGLPLLVGLLPASRQKKLSFHFDFDPSRASLFSALTLFLLCFPLFLYEGTQQAIGKPVFPLWIWIFLGYIALESALRAGAALILDEPTGTLLLFFLRSPASANRERDLYADLITVKASELLLTTHFPKPHIEEAKYITFEGKTYYLTDKKTFQYARIYNMRESGKVQFALLLDPQLERQRNIAANRSFVYAPLWGFLSSDWQHRIAAFGLYRPGRFTLFSIFCVLFLAIPAMVYEIARWALTGPTLLTLFRLPASLYLIQESLVRLIFLIQDKKPSGSVAGVLILPLARRFFRKAPS